MLRIGMSQKPRAFEKRVPGVGWPCIALFFGLSAAGCSGQGNHGSNDVGTATDTDIGTATDTDVGTVDDTDTQTAGVWQMITPLKNAGPDKNPLKGWNSGWGNDESWASVGFQYLKWDVLEPKNNEFDWDAVEGVLHKAGSRGRHLIIRFYCDWKGSYDGPDWLLDMVARRVSGDQAATDYDDPDFIREATEAIAAFVEHYDDDPRMFIFQLGTIGYWGEWHNYPNSEWWASVDTQQAVIDAYKISVSNALLQARYPWESALTGNTLGLGYHNDFFSAAEHSRSFDQAIDERDLWQQGHIGGEWPPGRPGEDFEAIFNSPLGEQVFREGHYSTMKPADEGTVLANWPDNFFNLHRLMGYNFQVQRVKYQVPEGGDGSMAIELDVENIGVAPFYRNWEVQLALLDDGNNVVEQFEVAADVRDWGPAQTHTISVVGNASLDPESTHRIALRILQPDADAAKDQEWGLDARNVYVVLANDVEVIEGIWNGNNALQGGWNILGEL